MHRHGNLTIPSTLGELADPARTALLVYDMQVGIASQVACGGEVTRKIGGLLAAARAAGMRVAYSRHLSLSRAWMGVAQMRMAMAWQRTQDPEQVRPWFLRGGAAIEIVPELAPQPDDMVFDKIAMSAFEGTFLATAMRDAGLTGLAIAGIATEIGIEPTARHAADLGFIPILLTDACGGGHAEAAERTIQALHFAGDAVITTTDEFVGALSSPA